MSGEQREQERIERQNKLIETYKNSKSAIAYVDSFKNFLIKPDSGKSIFKRIFTKKMFAYDLLYDKMEEIIDDHENNYNFSPTEPKSYSILWNIQADLAEFDVEKELEKTKSLPPFYIPISEKGELNV